MGGAAHRRSGARLLAVLAAAVALCMATGAPAAVGAVPSGTWVGWAGGPIAAGLPQERRAKFTITVGAQVLSVVATGPTGASHDSPTARAKCTWRFKFEKEQAGWRHYKQVAGTSAGAGSLETALCNPRPEGIARLRPAGAKLKIEFGTRYRSGDRFGDSLVYAIRA